MSDPNSPKATTDPCHVDASSDSLEPVELLADDFMRRQRAGENPSIEEYCLKHPELADEIRDVFPALVVIEKVAPDSADLDESARTLHSPDNQPIESIGDYRILREIGRGGMGVVYEAEQESLGRRVALKVLPRHAAKDEKSLLRFQREARAAAKMHHTNIVPVFEVGHDMEYSFYAMQLIKGQGLDHVIGDLRDLRSVHADPKKIGSAAGKSIGQNARGDHSLAHSLMTGHFEHRDFHDSDGDSDSAGAKKANENPALIQTTVLTGGSTVSAALPGQSDLSTAEDNRRAYFHSVAEIGLQSARALSYAHARGITHRDIKPSNLLLDTTGVVWITDFGLARTSDSSMTQTGDILGTIRYMSPERFKGQCDNRADVYSLGLTLYEMLVLKPAFESPDRLQLIDIVTKTEVTSPRSIDARIPRDLETIVLKAADKDPKRRYQSADDMADDLQRFVNDEPIHARRATAVERVARWSRRNPWLATAMSVSVAALIAVAGISALAAQEQSRLNDDLTVANDEQRKLNTELQQKTDEQQETNAALAETNRTNEELIRDLKKSQSRLAEKQADFVEEKGNLAESMLWLARSYELADGQTPEFRRNLLNKLEASAARMPRLIGTESPGIRNTGPLFGEEIRDRFQNAANDEERRAVFEEIRNSNALRRVQASPAMSADQTLIAYPILRSENEDSETPSWIQEIRVWDVGTGSWTGTTIRPELPVGKLAVHAEKRLIAAFLVEAKDENDRSADTATTGRNSGPSAIGTLTLAVWSIDSGELLLQRKVATDVSAARIGRPMAFRSDGTEVVALTGTVTAPDGVPVTVYSVATGNVVHEAQIQPEKTGRFLLSPDGERLIILNSLTSPGAARSAMLTCYDVDSGAQVGKTIETSITTIGRTINRPTILTPDGSRIALLSGIGRDQQIEIMDFETGSRVGGAIDVPRPASSSIAMLNANPSGTQLAVSILPTQAVDAGAPSGGTDLVQVFDVETGNAVAPPLPVSQVEFVAMPDGVAEWRVCQNEKIQTWQLPHSQLHRVVFPWQGMATLRSGRFGRGMGRMPSFSLQMSVAMQVTRGTRTTSSTPDANLMTSPGIELAINQQGHVLAAEKDQSGISLKTWDRQSGRLLSQKKLANTESSFVGMFSLGGEYLMTGHVGEGPEAAAYLQLWRTSTGTKHGQMFPLTRGVPDDNPLAVSPDGVWLLLRRRERTEQQVDVSAEKIPDGGFRRRVSGGFQTTLVVVDLRSGEETKVPFTSTLVTGQFSADARFVLVNSPTKQWRYDLKAGTFDPPLDATEIASSPAIPNRGSRSRGGSRSGPFGSGRGGFGGPRSRTLSRSSDGMLTATIVADSVVQIRPVGANGQIGREEDRLVELSHPSPVVRVAFDPESKLVVTAAADGLIRQWSLPERWDGTPEEIRQRVEQHTGIAFAEADQVVIAEDVAEVARTFSENGDNSVQPRNRHRVVQDGRPKLVASSTHKFLTRDESDAIRLRDEGRWEEADAALAKWAALRPDDWQPHALRMRTLVELRNFDEADAARSEAIHRIGRDAAYAWLKADFSRQHSVPVLGSSTRSDSPRYNRVDLETAAIGGWYHRHILENAPDDKTRAESLFEMAKIHEVELQLEEAAEAINQAVTLNPDSADMHYYRAHLMARLGRWAQEISSRREYARLQTKDTFSYFRLVAVLVNAGEPDEFWKAWHIMVAARKPLIDAPESNESTVAFNRDFVAKPCLIVGPQSKEDLDLALKYADLNYGLPVAQGRDIEHWFTLCKGIAEYRRGNLEDSSRILDDAYEGLRTFRNGEDDRGLALTQFFKAMTLHDLEKPAEAIAAYCDGEDYHLRDQSHNLRSRTSNWTDWRLAEAARRQAFSKLGLAESSIAKPLDTSKWTVLFEDNFDESISDDWQQMDGEWSVVDGAACGILVRPEGATFSAYDRLECAFPDLPSTFEIEYEVWTSAPMLAACFLRLPSEDTAPAGHRVALNSVPDRLFVALGKPGTGVSLLTSADFGTWDNQSVPDFQVEPSQHYKVRIIRQPQRITVFIDGKQILSERVRDIPTRSFRFFARGEEGTRMFLDNVRVRVPPEVQPSK